MAKRDCGIVWAVLCFSSQVRDSLFVSAGQWGVTALSQLARSLIE